MGFTPYGVQTYSALTVGNLTATGSTTLAATQTANILATSNIQTFGILQVAEGGNPTFAAGANAGSSPPTPVLGTGSTFNAGQVTFGTGTGAAAGAQVTASISGAFTNTPALTISPMNSATAALGLYISAISHTAWTLASTNAPTSSEPNTTYAFSYVSIANTD